MAKPKKKKLAHALHRVLSKAEKRMIAEKKAQAQLNAEKTRKKQTKNTITRPRPEYCSKDKLLLVGEGNFSFAKSLAENYLMEGAENMIATCYDSEEVLYEKYQEAKENIELIRELGATVMFNIDATHFSKEIRKNKYTKIIFNFPHAGAGIKDQDRNVIANQKLLTAFFQAAEPLLEKEGEIHITLKTCKPYDLWSVKGLARSLGVLATKGTRPFHPDDFPGYEHRRTLGYKEGVSKGGNLEILSSAPKTFIFVRKEMMKKDIERSLTGKRKRDEEDSDDEP
ncbi:hypothetical protein BCV72DRAFT_34930 [Rhizopus microsporus var. microsporus]|nr:hypothetical protein BCV72DRAFT_34930 [Rhizopus microsporus var. microsporus]